MDPVEIDNRRMQMGRGAGAMLIGGPAPLVDEGEGYWIALSGAPSPDMNMALVSAAGADVAARTLERVTDSGTPTLFMLAGACLSFELPTPWQHVGDVPFMASTLDGEYLRSDPRVRQALADDADIVCAVMCEAFGLAREVMIDVITAVVDDDDGPTKIWLLTEGDEVVSAALTSIVDDAVTVWCMSTPERFARRGFARAILADTLLRAKTGGATIGLLGATPAGKPLYDATGWVSIEHWRMFASAKSAQFDG